MSKTTKQSRQTRQTKSKSTTGHKKPQAVNKRLKARFLPAIAITLLATFLWSQPNFTLTNNKTNNSNDVLSYATNISHSGLLTATNTQRSSNGVGTLSISSQLNSAALAKANDMVARNYWSHQTPTGEQPWVFITNAGYQYLSAGENLAYGFGTSTETITGWMNSPTHKDNLLNANYTEVGFGIANSSNYTGTGEHPPGEYTIVVAMYAKPQTVSQPQVRSSENTKKSTNSKPIPATTEPDKNTQEQTQQPEPTTISEQPKSDDTTDPLATYADASSGSNTSKQVTRANILTGKAWSTTLVIALVCLSGLLWSLHRGYRLTQIIRNGTEIIGRNIHIDLIILAIIFLAYVLLSTSGYIG